MAKGRFRQGLSSFGQNWALTQRAYPALPLEIAGLILGGFAIGFLPLFLFLDNALTGVLVGIPLGLLAATFWFSRRAMRAAYRQIEGEPGASVAVVKSLRGGWQITPAVAVNKNQDMVSRVVGKPGVILISEGPSSRVVHLLANERKRTARWVPEVPIYEIQVGSEAGQVPLMKLQRELNKLPRNLRGGAITETRRRLEAVSQHGSPLPIPKGPVPTSARQVRRPR